MVIEQKKITARGIKFFVKDGQKEIARAFLYILKNGLHQRPFGFLEDVFVDEKYRGQGLGILLVKKAIKAAKREHCYKFIATSRRSRPRVHQLYKKLGFKDWGREFRIDYK